MSSCPTTGRPVDLSADLRGSASLLDSVPDPRARRGRRHGLMPLLVLGIAAVLCGARSIAAIAQWAAAHAGSIRIDTRVARAADESTFRRVIARVSADALAAVIGAWLWIRTRVVDGLRGIALDGKTVRGAPRRGRSQDVAPHLVAAFDHTAGAVLGQVAVAAKSNEIPAVRTLLGSFDLAGAVVSVDAMHTQTDTATAITEAGGEYVFTVKNNQPRLYAALKKLPWADVAGHIAVDTGHGRRARRTIKVATAPAWIPFAGAAQVAQIRRTVSGEGRKSVEVVYIITSADHHTASPSTLAGWVQGHWGIENQLHWCRDVTFDEDRSQVRTGHAPQVMATIRSTAISPLRLAGWANIAAALRHHARNPQRPVNLLLTC
ncbi:ISAs1 family transposase [soil metagenome]